MSTIKKLKLKLKSGLLSELQSDTIFGHFCWRMREQYGEESLNNFINIYHENNPVFTVSDGMIEEGNNIFYKKPYVNSEFNIKSNNKEERISNFLLHKVIKDRTHITIDQLNLFLNGDLCTYKNSFNLPGIKDLTIPKLKQDLRVSVGIDRETMSSKVSQLFSYNPNYLESKDDQTFFVVFIKIINENKYLELHCEEILRSVFEIGFGKKKSSGYGQFEVNSIESFNEFHEPRNVNGFITLGNYLPDKKDSLQSGFYEYNVKYGKLGEHLSMSENPFKKPIILFTSGSCFYTEKHKEFYGRVTNEGEISEKSPFAVQFGMPFTLNFKTVLQINK
jgi:CRISPR-associated protein Csm4